MSDLDVGADLVEPVEPPDGHDCIEDAGPIAKGAADASARGWGPGWPTDNGPKMAVVRAGGIALSVRAELAPVVAHLVDETVGRGYALNHGQCWGFANRSIRGSQRPSNHSWGLAVDLNAPANPMGDTLVTDMPGWMVEQWKARGFRWGGDYQGRKDAMHFEYQGTLDDARRLAAELGAAPAAAPAAAAPAPAAATGPLLKRGAAGPHVRRLQERLVAAGHAVGVDGDFGPATERAVVVFQQARGLGADGVVGPKTWAALG